MSAQPAVLTQPTEDQAADTVAALTGVTKRYRNNITALDNLSLTLRRGEIVALLGPNGAGKSTAVKLMMGLSAPTGGTVRIFGHDPRFAENRLRTGVMLQVGRAPETLRVREHIELFRGYYPTPLSAAELFHIAGLTGIEDRLFGQLSGGQKQRVLFALALAGDPDLVFLDEPTVGLDIESRRGLWRQIRTLAARGKTVLLTTHYLEEADALANSIVVIAKGRIVCEGTPAEVKAEAAARHLAPPSSIEALGQANQSNGRSGGTRGRNAAPNATPTKLIHCVTSLTREHLLRIPHVTAVDTIDSRTTLTTAQPEATLREMLALDSTLSHLEVTSPALEDAFLTLTAEPAL